jgi:hypothetical protein
MATILGINNIAEVNITLADFSVDERRNINNVVLFTTDTPINSEVYGIYNNSKDVSTNYGSTTLTYKCAKAIYAQNKTIKTGKGKLIIVPLLVVLTVVETIKEAIIRCKDQGFPFFHGILTTKTLLDAEVLEVANYIQDYPMMFQYDFNNRTVNDVTALIEDIQVAGYTKTCIGIQPSYLSSDSSRIKSCEVMSRLLSTDFSSDGKTAQTIHLKKLISDTTENTGILQSDIDRSVITGAMCYQNFETVGARVFESGANEYRDNIYHQNWLKVSIEDEIALTIANSKTKIGQTNEGMQSLLSVVLSQLERAVSLGVAGLGLEWRVEVPFGNDDIFKDSIKKFGYYAIVGDVNDQSLVDRQNRQGTLIQWALAFEGAVHKVNGDSAIIGTIQR